MVTRGCEEGKVGRCRQRVPSFKVIPSGNLFYNIGPKADNALSHTYKFAKRVGLLLGALSTKEEKINLKKLK